MRFASSTTHKSTDPTSTFQIRHPKQSPPSDIQRFRNMTPTNDVLPKAKSPLVPPNGNFSEDELVVKQFVDLVQDRIDSGILGAPRGEEGRLLRNAVVSPGMYAGIALGMVQFAVLRKAPVYVMNRMHPKGFQEAAAMKPLSVLLDGSLSLLTAGATWAWMADKEKIYGTAAAVPLLAGRSQVSDALCQDFIGLSDGVREGFWAEHRDDGIRAISTFVSNCRRRQAFERRLRRERGLGPAEPVSIPEGGVPQEFVDEADEAGDWAAIEEFEEEGGTEVPESFWGASTGSPK